MKSIIKLVQLELVALRALIERTAEDVDYHVRESARLRDMNEEQETRAAELFGWLKYETTELNKK